MIVPSQMQVLTAASRRPLTGAPIHRLPRRHRRALAADDVTIRAATHRDDDVVGRLEQLDGRVLTPGMRLLAELGGVTVAAIAVADDTVVADPFERTAAVADLLRVRARQLRTASTPRPAPRLALIERLAR